MWNKSMNFCVVTGMLSALILAMLCQSVLAAVYTDSKRRFSLELPENWKVQSDKSGVASFTAPDGITSLLIFPKEVLESTALGTLPAAYEQLIKESQPNISLKMLKETRVKIAGQVALQREYSLARDADNRIMAMVTFVKSGRLSLTLAATTSERGFARSKQVFQELLQTLRFRATDTVTVAPVVPLDRMTVAPVQPLDRLTIAPIQPLDRLTVAPVVPLDRVAVIPDLPTEGVTIPPHIEDMIEESSFIFMGTVKRAKAATMPNIQVDDTIIVRVDKVFQAAKALGDYTDKDITVQLKQPGSAKTDQRMVFFTNGWLYGKSIAVREVGKLPVEQEVEKLQKQVMDGIGIVAGKNLQRHIALAELVIAGKVTDVRPSSYDRTRKESEHNPLWYNAVIEIGSVEKGRFSQKTITVLFPGTTDVMWYRSPKFTVDQEGIWVLHRDIIKELSIEGVEGYTALAPLDAYRREDIDRIKGIIKRIQ